MQSDIRYVEKFGKKLIQPAVCRTFRMRMTSLSHREQFPVGSLSTDADVCKVI